MPTQSRLTIGSFACVADSLLVLIKAPPTRRWDRGLSMCSKASQAARENTCRRSYSTPIAFVAEQTTIQTFCSS